MPGKIGPCRNSRPRISPAAHGALRWAHTLTLTFLGPVTKFAGVVFEAADESSTLTMPSVHGFCHGLLFERVAKKFRAPFSSKQPLVSDEHISKLAQCGRGGGDAPAVAAAAAADDDDPDDIHSR
jgi:hypothetical protein